MNRTLIAIATEPDNRFNALFLDERLKTFSMPDRDVHWSTYLASLAEDTEENPVDTLIEWTAANAFGHIDEHRAELIGITLAWFLSTNHRAVRDLATKALASLLVKRIPLATKLVDRFACVDDLYVVERVFAAAYGAALQCPPGSDLQALASAAHEAVFKPDPPIVHVLLRDYARGILECAHRRGGLPPGIAIESGRPPYRSPWPLETVSDAEIETYVYTVGDKTKIRDSIVSSAVNEGDFARYIIDTSLQDATALPIVHVGQTREDLFLVWRGRLEKDRPDALPALIAVETAADAFRSFESTLGGSAYLYRLPWREKEAPSLETQRVLDEISRLDSALQASESALEAALGARAWRDYQLYGQAHIHLKIHSEERHFHWPPRFSRTLARRFVCKCAHDLGWTEERFSELEKGLGGSRNEHRIERVGKKYQWIALHELLARVGDNVAFRDYGDGEDELVLDPGPWDHRGRDIDPSLLATESQDDEDSCAWVKTWWMRQAVRMKPVPPMQRLEWLDENVDVVDGTHLIEATQPATNKRWLVVDEFLNWNQSAVRDGEDRLERTCFSDVNAVIVAKGEREQLLAFLSNRIVFSHDLIPLEFPWRAFIGEYPWHPSCMGVSTWATVRDGNLRIAPAGGEYHASRSGHDYSIKRDIRFSVPSALLVQGLALTLSDGRELTYVDQAGVVRFFDPSTKQLGPRAALVDRDAFLAFLERDGLDAVWVISGEKSVHGGPHGRGWGGERRFTSLYWLTPRGFDHKTFWTRNDPGPEQVRELFDGSPIPAAAWRIAIANYRPPASKAAPKRALAAKPGKSPTEAAIHKKSKPAAPKSSKAR